MYTPFSEFEIFLKLYVWGSAAGRVCK